MTHKFWEKNKYSMDHNAVSVKECEMMNRKYNLGNFPDGPVAKTPHSQCREPGV